MIFAHIKNTENFLVGTIDQAGDVYSIMWRERRKEHPPGNVHTPESEKYPNAEEAKQAVYRVVPNAQIYEVSE